ncbi:hypothetical protein ACLX1H_009234 [Fusarium chlamydosporum]
MYEPEVEVETIMPSNADNRHRPQQKPGFRRSTFNEFLYDKDNSRFLIEVLNAQEKPNNNAQQGQRPSLINTFFHGPTSFNGNIHGGVNIVQSFHQSSFSSLRDNVKEFTKTEIETLRSKKKFEDGRSPFQSTNCIDLYSPYTVVEDPKIKQVLRHIATHCEFLDTGFAEYFKEVVPFFGRDFVTEQLAHIRKAIADSRGQNQSRSDKPTHVYLGDLGQFCEEVCKSWKASEEIPHFSIRHQSEEETWRYLQDALEVHYWKHMLYLFSRWQQQTKAWSGEAVSRVLQSVEHILRHQIRHLKALSDKHGVDIKPITDGIEARIVVLESFSSGRTLQCGEEYDCNCFSHGLRKVEDDHLTQQLDGDGNRSTETVTLIALVLIFLIIAMIPGYKGFSLSMKGNQYGSTSDADYWYLIQSNIMGVLGNLVMVIPLLRRSWFSPAYNYMWLFFGLGLIFATTSVITYTLCNTGWSSMISFFGSVCSVASVLVMTQETARELDSIYLD